MKECLLNTAVREHRSVVSGKGVQQDERDVRLFSHPMAARSQFARAFVKLLRMSADYFKNCEVLAGTLR